jgi:hypothetical protein
MCHVNVNLTAKTEVFINLAFTESPHSVTLLVLQAYRSDQNVENLEETESKKSKGPIPSFSLGWLQY